MTPRKSPPSLDSKSGGHSTKPEPSSELTGPKSDFVTPNVKPSSTVLELGERWPASEPAERAAAAPVSLPCLNSNNSIENTHTLWAPDDPLTAILRAQRDQERKARKLGKMDSSGRTKVDVTGCNYLGHKVEGEIWLGGLSSSEKRAGYALSVNLAWLADKYGLERLGFLTLTFVENLKDPTLAQKRFNSLATNFLRKVFAEYICVVECQKRGAIHYHLLVVSERDVRTGFNFDEAHKGVYSSASPYLRGLWKQLRETMPKYGFGRSELLPVKTTVSGITNYVGKYLSKASAYRGQHMKGARLVRYSQGWRVANQRFSWVSLGGARWRHTVSKFAAATGCNDYSDLKRRHGRYWAKKLAATLEELRFDQSMSFDELCEHLAEAWGVKSGS